MQIVSADGSNHQHRPIKSLCHALGKYGSRICLLGIKVQIVDKQGVFAA